jgi:hypothetical protein
VYSYSQKGKTMFWAMFSSREYDEQMWPVVWESENIVQSILAFEWSRLRKMDAPRRARCIKNLSVSMIEHSGTTMLEASWLERFIHDHQQGIHEFLAAVPENFTPSSETMGFRRDVLAECLARSAAFRRFIEGKGEAGGTRA